MRPASILFCLFLSIVILAGQAFSNDGLNADYYFSRGEAYNRGQNYPEAFKWYKKAAELGHAGAQNMVSVLYDKGVGVSQDTDESLRWLRLSVDQGFAMAQVNLSYAYYTGKGVAKDLSRAKELLHMAAKQRNHAAMIGLATVYDEQSNYVKGIAWAWVAWTLASNYDEEQFALDLRTSIARRDGVTQEIIDQAEALTNSILQTLP